MKKPSQRNVCFYLIRTFFLGEVFKVVENKYIEGYFSGIKY